MSNRQNFAKLAFEGKKEILQPADGLAKFHMREEIPFIAALQQNEFVFAKWHSASDRILSKTDQRIAQSRLRFTIQRLRVVSMGFKGPPEPLHESIKAHFPQRLLAE